MGILVLSSVTDSGRTNFCRAKTEHREVVHHATYAPRHVDDRSLSPCPSITSQPLPLAPRPTKSPKIPNATVASYHVNVPPLECFAFALPGEFSLSDSDTAS